MALFEEPGISLRESVILTVLFGAETIAFYFGLPDRRDPRWQVGDVRRIGGVSAGKNLLY